MRDAGYFEAPVARYAKTIAYNADTIATNIGEPLVVAIGGVQPPPTPPGPLPGPGAPTTPTIQRAGGAALAVLFAVGGLALVVASKAD